MRVLLQRVTAAHVSIGGDIVGAIDAGVMLLVGFGDVDRDNIDSVIAAAIEKVINLRIFANDQGKMDFSLLDIRGEILAIPQFTLYGKANKGRRPDFTEALSPQFASPAFDQFVGQLQTRLNSKVAAGIFGADMQVSLVNDGPLTLHLAF